jgi:hypothetical protein
MMTFRGTHLKPSIYNPPSYHLSNRNLRKNTGSESKWIWLWFFMFNEKKSTQSGWRWKRKEKRRRRASSSVPCPRKQGRICLPSQVGWEGPRGKSEMVRRIKKPHPRRPQIKLVALARRPLACVGPPPPALPLKLSFPIPSRSIDRSGYW